MPGHFLEAPSHDSLHKKDWWVYGWMRECGYVLERIQNSFQKVTYFLEPNNGGNGGQVNPSTLRPEGWSLPRSHGSNLHHLERIFAFRRSTLSLNWISLSSPPLKTLYWLTHCWPLSESPWEGGYPSVHRHEAETRISSSSGSVFSKSFPDLQYHRLSCHVSFLPPWCGRKHFQILLLVAPPCTHST